MELNNMEMASNNMELNKQYPISEIVESKQLMRRVLRQAIAMEMTEKNVGKLTDLVIACQNASLDFQTEQSTIWDENASMDLGNPDYYRVIYLQTLSNNALKISDDVLKMMRDKLPESSFESVSQFISESVDSYAQSKANQSQSNMSHGAK